MRRNNGKSNQIIVKFMGGLGNQLFIYGLYKKFKTMGRIVRADITEYCTGVEKRPFSLTELGINLNIAQRDEIRIYSRKNPINIIKNKAGMVCNYMEKVSYIYDEHVLKLDNAYVTGYWQNPKYFDDIKDILLRDIKFPSLNYKNEGLKNKIMSENAVAVHVRMGDYLKFSKKYGDICDTEYYRRAFNTIESRIESPIYYGFSDDVLSAKRVIKDMRKIRWIESTEVDRPYDDLNIMKSCKHFVLANSSFSWWGGYLGDYTEKIVISPNKWVNTSDKCDIWCEDWIRI